MNFIQRLQTSHLHRHGFIDVLVGVVVLKAIYVALILFFCNLNDVSDDKGPSSLWLLVFVMLLIAPLFENLLMIAIAAAHEKLFKRTLLFVVTPRLARVLPPDYALPTDSYIPPTRREYFWNGQLEGKPPEPTPTAPNPARPETRPQTQPESQPGATPPSTP
jgi:hypothetical protein